MLAKFGRITVPLLFKVWFADLPLEIDLSDAKLSQIKQWRVPANTDRSVQAQPDQAVARARQHRQVSETSYRHKTTTSECKASNDTYRCAVIFSRNFVFGNIILWL